MAYRHPRRVSPAVFLAAELLAVCLTAGCGPSIAYTFEDAESRQRSEDAPILILYKDSLDPASGQMQENLFGGQSAAALNHKIPCVLVTDYEPNRRYVARFGVERPPALILLHRDGTYHARQGLLSPEQIKTFVASAQPPGAAPNNNAPVPRRIDYLWENDFDRAVNRAKQRNRELFIVYKSWTNADSTELVLNRLMRPEVFVHFVDTVNCILDDSFPANRTYISRFGIDRVPAMVLVHRDSTYHARIGLPTPEEIVRFAVTSRTAGRVGMTGAPAAETVGVRVRR